MRELSDKKETVDQWRGIEKRLIEAAEFLYISMDEEDSNMEKELSSEIADIERTLEEMEFSLAFSGPFDKRSAILSIHAGAGGTESQDWANMLLRMYLRWSERRRYSAEILDISEGEEAGIKSAVLEIKGKYAYGYLKSEHGVHRLVRLSPFDSDHARHTSFALVEVLPVAESNVDITINPEDIKIDVFRSSGPGGQHMQKSSTAVRITHIPSGLVVSSQNERSQLQNKNIAMKILEAKLFEKELERQAEEKARIKGKRIDAEWGSQIRSYVLHPYKMVKDHRTEYQSSNPDSVLDGYIDEFLIEYLRSTAATDDE
jgi:peptide chain release factor 2